MRICNRKILIIILVMIAPMFAQKILVHGARDTVSIDLNLSLPDSLSEEMKDSLIQEKIIEMADEMAEKKKQEKKQWFKKFAMKKDYFLNNYILANRKAVKLYDKEGNMIGLHVIDDYEGLLQVWKYDDSARLTNLTRPYYGWKLQKKIMIASIYVKTSAISVLRQPYYTHPVYDVSIGAEFVHSFFGFYESVHFGRVGSFAIVYIGYRRLCTHLYEEVYNRENTLMTHGITVEMPLIFLEIKLKNDIEIGFEWVRFGFSLMKYTLSDQAYYDLQTNFATKKNGQWKFNFVGAPVIHLRYKKLFVSVRIDIDFDRLYTNITMPVGIEFNMEANR